MEISEEKQKKSKIREQLGILLICLVLGGSGYLLMRGNASNSGIKFVEGDTTQSNTQNTTTTGSATKAATTSVTSSQTLVTDKVNINTASLEDLDKLPGVGPATAQKIVDYRTNNGSFKSIDEIKEVSGIGDAKYAQMKDKISI